MRRDFLILIASLAWLLAAPLVAAAPTTLPAKAERPREVIGQAGCVRAECHGSIRNYAVVHGPVGVNACDACHELVDAEAHTFRMVRDNAETCTYCHEFNVSAMRVVHKPVQEGQCLGCHDPHGGASKALLREKTVQDLCNRCHEPVARGRAFLHTPVKEGACDSCHPPHASRFPKLLDLAGPDLCLACHEGFERTLSAATFTHKALEEGCQKCHDPHGSAHPMATTQPVAQQCSNCHQQVKTDALAARYAHTPVTSGDACVTCHTPHGGNLARLVSDTPERLCTSCHKEEQKTNRGYVIQPLAELATPGAHKHGGIKDGSCAGCHAAHGGDRQLFLSKNYVKSFYVRYSPQQYELCFSCHDAKLVEEERTTSVTAFRNGERNLHTLHVRETRERGENCRVCHNTHAGANGKIVRDVIRYGTWEMPVRFQQSASGGSCYPGCHPNYGYDRDNPIANLKGQPTTLPSFASATAERPSEIEMRLTDVTGADVTVPDGPLPTVIALLRTDQAQTQRVLKMVTRATRAASDAEEPCARVIVMLSGPGADALAPPLAASPTITVISDESGALAGELEVRGWPTVLVVRPDGLEIARLAGSAETLSAKLIPYLALAAGRADSTPTTRPAGFEVVGEEPTVRQVERLIRNDKPDQALALLMQLPDGAIAPWRHNLLGAQALVALKRWDDARDAARAAAEQNPASREAHHLLGQIYEQQSDWPRAAAAYRKAAGRD